MTGQRAWVGALGVLARLWLGLLVVVVVVRLLGAERGGVMLLLVGALPLTLLPAWVMTAVWAVRRAWVPAALALAVVVAHVALVLPSITPATAPGPGPALRVGVANLYVLNERPADAGRALRALDLDVLVVPELDADGLDGLRASGLLDDLPHSLVELDTRSETVGLLSRLPLQDTSVRRVGGRALPRATVSVSGVDVRLHAEHPLPPVDGLERLWRRALSSAADDVRAEDLPMVVLGDLNADRDHAAFRRLLGTGLRDAHDERGRGLARTFPAWLPVLHLDHVLVRDGDGARMAVRSVREVDLPGSDHLGVVAELVVTPAG